VVTASAEVVADVARLDIRSFAMRAIKIAPTKIEQFKKLLYFLISNF